MKQASSHYILNVIQISCIISLDIDKTKKKPAAGHVTSFPTLETPSENSNQTSLLTGNVAASTIPRLYLR